MGYVGQAPAQLPLAVTSADITDLAIVNADVNASAALAFSKLAALSDGNILVGSSGNVPTSVNPSGDVDVTNAGVFSIASDSVINADIKSDAAIAISKLATITLATNTTGDYVQNITAGTGLTSSGATSGENIAHSLSVDASQAGITTVGTIGAGVWEGTTVAVAQGGTGATTLTDLITLGTHTTGDYAATITAGTGLTSTGATSGESIAHSLSVDAAQTGITSIINSTLKIQADPGSNAAGDVSYSFQTDTDTGMYLSGTNEISWATAGAQEMLLQADGDLHVEGDVIAFSTTVGSDINLKENVQTLPNALETINRLRGVSFDWKKKHKGSSIGVIAQEVEKVFPELVDEHALNGMKTVNYSALIGVLIEAVKELSDKVGD